MQTPPDTQPSTQANAEPNSSNHRFYGIAAVLLSAACFGCLAIFARMTYASGANLWGALPVRMLVAGVVLGVVVLAARLQLPRRGQALALVLMGAVGYVLQSVCYFAALNYAPAGLVALLLYLYPAFVMLVSVMFLGEHFSRGKLLALLLALVGCGLTIFGASAAGTTASAVQTLGVVLGLSAALVYTAYILVGERAGQGVHPVVSTAIVCFSAGVMFVLIALGRLALQQFGFDTPVQLPATALGWAANIGMAFVSTVASILLFFYGMKQIGATQASVFSTFEPVVTVVLAAVFLAEPVGQLQWLGGALVLSAAISLAQQSR